ncbi:MAG: BrnT family toxin [Holophagaceae bacterium]|nr:BrnT family toxin [Holophagaceae bacterium]
MERIIWDEDNAIEHWRKHHISFEDAKLIFKDPFRITGADNRFDYGENRYWTIGKVENRYLMLYVAHTIEENGDTVITIISARKAEPLERRLYGNRKL